MLAVHFYKLCIIHIAAESALYSFQICFVTICCQLNAVCQACAHIIHKFDCILTIATTNEIADNHFAVGVERRPRPIVASLSRCGLRFRYIFLLSVYKRPDFIALNAFSRNVANGFIMILRTLLTSRN